MSAATVSAEIARLEAIGRACELSDRESWALQKMLSTQRRYASRRASRENDHVGR